MQTASGHWTTLPDNAVKQLAASVAGKVLTAASSDGDDASAVWNAHIDWRPVLIVRCLSVEDVQHAVRFARAHDISVAVRGGGHDIAAGTRCHSGFIIDVSPLRRVYVDPLTKRARVEAGATLGEIDAQTQKFWLATPLGITSTTGLGALTMDGGFGWLSRRFGLTIDNVTGVEMVTANGERVRASATEHPDLFWGLRGGGHFGVVTSFDFQLHQASPRVLAGLIVYPLDEMKPVLQFYRRFAESAPEHFTCQAVMCKAPPLRFLSPAWHGQEVLVLAICYSGDVEEGKRVVWPLRTFGRPIADAVATRPYTGWQTMFDSVHAPGARNYRRSQHLTSLSDSLINILLAYARHLPDPGIEIALLQLGGAVSRVPHYTTAFRHREGQYVLTVQGRWDDPASDTHCTGWAGSLLEATAGFSTENLYLNAPTREDADRLLSAQVRRDQRLAELNHKYDPANLFRVK